MSQIPANNDGYNDLLYKLAKNFYDTAISLGGTGLTEPMPGWSDADLLKNAVYSTAATAS